MTPLPASIATALAALEAEKKHHESEVTRFQNAIDALCSTFRRNEEPQPYQQNGREPVSEERRRRNRNPSVDAQARHEINGYPGLMRAAKAVLQLATEPLTNEQISTAIYRRFGHRPPTSSVSPTTSALKKEGILSSSFNASGLMQFTWVAPKVQQFDTLMIGEILREGDLQVDGSSRKKIAPSLIGQPVAKHWNFTYVRPVKTDSATS